MSFFFRRPPPFWLGRNQPDPRAISKPPSSRRLPGFSPSIPDGRKDWARWANQGHAAVRSLWQADLVGLLWESLGWCERSKSAWRSHPCDLPEPLQLRRHSSFRTKTWDTGFWLERWRRWQRRHGWCNGIRHDGWWIILEFHDGRRRCCRWQLWCSRWFRSWRRGQPRWVRQDRAAAVQTLDQRMADILRPLRRRNQWSWQAWGLLHQEFHWVCWRDRSKWIVCFGIVTRHQPRWGCGAEWRYKATTGSRPRGYARKAKPLQWYGQQCAEARPSREGEASSEDQHVFKGSLVAILRQPMRWHARPYAPWY